MYAIPPKEELGKNGRNYWDIQKKKDRDKIILATKVAGMEYLRDGLD